MSLTRKEWEEMWNTTEYLMQKAKKLREDNRIKDDLIIYLGYIKNKIQQVIGQME